MSASFSPLRVPNGSRGGWHVSGVGDGCRVPGAGGGGAVPQSAWQQVTSSRAVARGPHQLDSLAIHHPFSQTLTTLTTS